MRQKALLINICFSISYGVPRLTNGCVHFHSNEVAGSANSEVFSAPATVTRWQLEGDGAPFGMSKRGRLLETVGIIEDKYVHEY